MATGPHTPCTVVLARPDCGLSPVPQTLSMKEPSPLRMARGGSGTSVALVLLLVALMAVPSETWTRADHPADLNPALDFFRPGPGPDVDRAPRSTPQASGSDTVTWSLCLLNNTLLSGNVGCPSSGIHPDGVAWDPANGDLYIPVCTSGMVDVISGTTNRVVATIHVGGYPSAAVYDAQNGNVYVTNQESGNVSVISGTTNGVVANVPVGSVPSGVAYDGGTGDIYVVNQGSNNVTVISGRTNRAVAAIPVGNFPVDATYDGGNGDVYVTNNNCLDIPCVGQGSVSVISGITKSVVAMISVGVAPSGAAYDSANGEVYVTNANTGNVSVISGVMNWVVAAIPVGVQPTDAAYGGANGEVYIVNSNCPPSPPYTLCGPGSVSVISGGSNQVVATIGVGLLPGGVAYDGRNGEVYVTNFNSGSVSIITAGSPTNGGSGTPWGGGLPWVYIAVGVVLAVPVVAAAVLLLRRRKPTHRGSPPASTGPVDRPQSPS